MKITEDKNVPLIVGDIETMAGLMDFGFYDPDSKEWFEFEISEFKNEMLEFVNFYVNSHYEYVVGYNYLKFDAQVIQYLIENYHNWVTFNNLEIIDKLYMFTQRLIRDQKYAKFSTFKESELSKKVIDVFTILGLDNLARSSSLKKCQFQLDLESVEEMPIHHSTKVLTEEHIQMIKSYRRNDVISTLEVFNLCLGNTEHPLYKGNNQVELRFDIKEEFNLECLNYSDIKIGEELMIRAYLEEVKIDRKDFPRTGTFRKTIKLKECVPDYIEFESKQLKDILKSIKSRTIRQDEVVHYNFKINGTEYDLKNGGIHSKNDAQCFNSSDDYYIYTSDVASYYPVSKIKRRLFPAHLGEKFLNAYEKRYNKRIELKPLSKNNKKIKGICDAIKLQCNIVFGKMGSKESPFFDMKALLSVTIGNEITILKLIEDLELAGFHVISANTDGFETMVLKSKEEEYLSICKKWEDLTEYILEHGKYDWIKYSTVNDYIAKISTGEYKTKGDLNINHEIYKNKSWKVVSLALYEYFTIGKNPIDFINEHNNIFDFCLMCRAKGELRLETQKIIKEGNWQKEMDINWLKISDDSWIKREHIGVLDYLRAGIPFEEMKEQCIQDSSQVEIKNEGKLMRYYLSTDSEWSLFKRGIGSTGKPTNVNFHAGNDLGKVYIKNFNTYVDIDNYNIDKKQYIFKALKIIDKIEKTKKLSNFINSLKPQKQLELW